MFRHGHGNLPPGNYFEKSAFTIMIWVELLSYNRFQSIMDFGNGKASDNIMLEFKEETGLLRFYYMDENQERVYKYSPDSIPIGVRTHIAVTYENQQIKFFTNGILKFTYLAAKPIVNKTRRSIFIGRNNFPNDKPIDAILDELKIFDRVLSDDDIKNEMTKLQLYSNILLV